MSPVVEVRQAGFRFADRFIFKGLDLEVFDGEVLTILGPNGCGKSTLLRCIGGVHPLAEGSVRLEGVDVGQLDPGARARKLGFLFQDHAPTFPFSVLEVASMGRAPHLGLFSAPGAADLKRAEAALAQVGILHLKLRPYTALSGGERQLVLLARTLVQESKIVLLDEPTAHLDFKNQVQCLNAVGALAAQGMTLIMTTHDPNHALLYAGRVLLMWPGGAVRVGIAREMLTDAVLSELYGIEMRVLPQHVPARSGGTVNAAYEP